MKTSNLPGSSLCSDLLRKMDAWWRPASHLSVGQTHIHDNPTLIKRLKKEHARPRWLGHSQSGRHRPHEATPQGVTGTMTAGIEAGQRPAESDLLSRAHHHRRLAIAPPGAAIRFLTGGPWTACLKARPVQTSGLQGKPSCAVTCGPHGRTRRATSVLKPKRMFIWLLTLALAATVSTGCKSYSPSRYVSPRVNGRVVDAQTQQPVAGVQVRRAGSGQPGRAATEPRGAERLMQAPPIRTAADGTFEVASVRSLAFFRKLGWYSVSLVFQHPAYQPLTATYSPKDATTTAHGEPVVNAGEIKLAPRSP